MAAEFDVPVPPPPLPPDPNIAPTREVPVVVTVAGSAPPARALAMARWGLVPSWAKDPSIGQRMINARSETVGEKPAYRRAFARSRCLVPADAYYEWAALPGRRKQPYLFRPVGGALIAMAGLVERWRDRTRPDDDPAAWLTSMTILTMPAAGAPAGIHDRMPVTVPRALRGDWLDPDGDGDRVLPALLDAARDAAAAGTWESYPVSTALNSGREHGPALMEPVEPTGGE